MSLIRSVTLACAALSAFIQSAEASGSPPKVKTVNGTYVGVHSSVYNQDFFLGVPYAQPPVGNLRFSNPKSLNTSFTQVRDATQYPPACVGYGGDDVAYPALSEDCLYLNVIRPSSQSNIPVAVWIHGGGYYMGSSIDPRYNLSYIVKQGEKNGQPFIGVSINYRLSTWGFLSSKEVQASGQTNLGLRDQRLALKWVQENIEAFGGDPTKVTIWGESAGAGSVGAQLIAYNGRNDHLFRAAIMESGGPVQLLSLAPNQVAFDSLTSQVGCASAADKLQCLRLVPFNTLNSVINSTGLGTVWAPVKDGDFIAQTPSTQLKNGAFTKVPIIIGTNSDEGTAFSPTGVDNTTVFYNNLLTYPVPAPVPSAFAKQILTAYPDVPSQGIPSAPLVPADFRPGPPFGAQFRRSAAYYGDATFIASKRLACQTWAKNGLNAYCYRFNTFPAGLPQIIGVTHFQEVAFVFENTDGLGYAVSPFAGEPKTYTQLAQLMSSSWASFIYNLDPNSWRSHWNVRATPDWPAYCTTNGENIVWDANVTGLANLETDSFRATGIKLIMDNLATVYNA